MRPRPWRPGPRIIARLPHGRVRTHPSDSSVRDSGDRFPAPA
jgi:hypothetical protein